MISSYFSDIEKTIIDEEEIKKFVSEDDFVGLSLQLLIEVVKKTGQVSTFDKNLSKVET